MLVKKVSRFESGSSGWERLTGFSDEGSHRQ